MAVHNELSSPTLTRTPLTQRLPSVLSWLVAPLWLAGWGAAVAGGWILSSALTKRGILACVLLAMMGSLAWLTFRIFSTTPL